ncbi:MAG: aldolase/citrate lyase family protein [Chloroflexota bacterium]
MRENKLKAMWQNGETVLNGWLQIPSSVSAEVMAHQGWDSLTIDMQHGAVDYQVAVTMLQAISTTDTVPMARVPWNEPGIIMKMLDAGCYGIICPMVNNRAEAEAFVGACRYPPYGYRSHGPHRAILYGGSDYPAKANDVVITMAMIETAEAMENLEDILTVPGLDAIYVGPADLSRSLTGKPGSDFADVPVVEALDTIIAACKKHNIIAGLHTGSSDYTLQMFEKGFQFSTIMSDTGLLKSAAMQQVSAVKNTQQADQNSGPY